MPRGHAGALKPGAESLCPTLKDMALKGAEHGGGKCSESKVRWPSAEQGAQTQEEQRKPQGLDSKGERIQKDGCLPKPMVLSNFPEALWLIKETFCQSSKSRLCGPLVHHAKVRMTNKLCSQVCSGSWRVDDSSGTVGSLRWPLASCHESHLREGTAQQEHRIVALLGAGGGCTNTRDHGMMAPGTQKS